MRGDERDEKLGGKRRSRCGDERDDWTSSDGDGVQVNADLLLLGSDL